MNLNKHITKLNQENVYNGDSLKGYGKAHFAKKNFKKGDIVVHGFGRLLDHQTEHCSIQIDVDKHILPNKWTGRYWNHSCNPNTYASTGEHNFPVLRASRKISSGDEITYSYWQTELRWSNSAAEKSIRCMCGEKKCKKQILSFEQLPKQIQNKLILKRLCSRYLTKLKKI